MRAHHTRLLGREAPKLQLEESLLSARAGRGQIVSVEGEAGIGKTSLAVAFAEAHRADARVYVGGCEHLASGPLRR